MNTLAALGLKQNLDIRKAVARIEQAQGVFEAAGYPLSGQVRVGEAKLNDASDADRTVTGFARAEASWRLDLFGELENEKKSAEASLDAAFEDAEISRLTLLTEALSAYIDPRYAQELIRTNARITKSREETLAVTESIREQSEAAQNQPSNGQRCRAISRVEGNLSGLPFEEQLLPEGRRAQDHP